jgi:hypothetical protein
MTYLQSILPGKAFTTKITRKRLDCQMNSLVSLEIMVSTERLNALIALERPL